MKISWASLAASVINIITVGAIASSIYKIIDTMIKWNNIRPSYMTDDWSNLIWAFEIFILLIVVVFPIVTSIFALRKTHWNVALAFSVTSILSWAMVMLFMVDYFNGYKIILLVAASLLSVIPSVLLLISRKEFKQPLFPLRNP